MQIGSVPTPVRPTRNAGPISPIWVDSPSFSSRTKVSPPQCGHFVASTLGKAGLLPLACSGCCDCVATAASSCPHSQRRDSSALIRLHFGHWVGTGIPRRFPRKLKREPDRKNVPHILHCVREEPRTFRCHTAIANARTWGHLSAAYYDGWKSGLTHASYRFFCPLISRSALWLFFLFLLW
jgi:hypothetical protein